MLWIEETATHDTLLTGINCGRPFSGYTNGMNEQTFSITKFSDLANPTRFLALATRILPWLAGLTALVLAAGLYMSFTSEGDYQQGYTVRIMYVHVPSAWLAMMCYSVMAISAIGTLVWRHPIADVSHKAAAPLARPSRSSHLSPVRSGASLCGEPGGCGMRG